VDDELFDEFGFGKVESARTGFAASVELDCQRLRLKAEASDSRAIEFEFRAWFRRVIFEASG
jgi:hypothetical protein